MYNLAVATSAGQRPAYCPVQPIKLCAGNLCNHLLRPCKSERIS